MRTRGVLTLLLGLGLVATACGDDGNDSTATGGDPVDVSTDVGVDDDEIRVAVLNDFSGPIASIGTPAAVGSEVYFDALNDDGGVCGRQVTVVSEDTQYDTQEAIQAYRAVEGDVAFITQLLGTETVFALSDDIERDNLTTLAGTLAGGVIPLPNIYIVQTPFALEAINGVTWAAEEHAGEDGDLRLGVIYQNDAYGEEGLAAVEYAAEELDNVELVADSSYATGDQDLTAQVQAMESADAEVVWLHDTPQQTAGILGAAAQRDYQPVWMGTSGSYGSQLVEGLGELLDGLQMVNSNASWGQDVPEMADLVAAVETYAPDQEPDNWLVTGWISATITHAALERACDMGDLTRDGLADAMDGLEVDLGGMAPDLSYGTEPNERIPSRSTQVNEIDLETTFPTPVSDYITSDAAEVWTLPDS